jgi:hypothetical protein
MLKTAETQPWLLAAVICLSTGLGWSLLPTVGWSYYALEGAQTSCSVKWEDPSFNVVSYNIAMFLFVFIVPLTFLLVTNYKLILLESGSFIQFIFTIK